ncbi:hypothetical protein [Nocardia sp. CDC160]|uniref:hypothetical protein n=1 Tax=Nocardia sp. CDC160 TaxID=3112166 RepID=UPI002DBFE285|nr:hypothetical protein [Nocardia sp. CDC160]MEC3915517.1 hypothetical protein [Nocardia sp. CDC160]
MLPCRKPLLSPPPIAVGYINRHRIPDGVPVETIGMPLRAWASEFGYAWGGTYLAQSADQETVSALIRRARVDRTVEIVVVPNTDHFPAGQCVILAGERCVQVVAVRR